MIQLMADSLKVVKRPSISHDPWGGVQRTLQRKS